MSRLRLSLGARLKHLREQRGLTQEHVALEAGFQRQYYSDLERGKRNPSLESLHKVALVLQVSLAEMFIGVEG